MGKLIRCSSKIAERPFRFVLTGTGVYSIEEVCYYIRKNIFVLELDAFRHGFASWLRDELEMVETASKIDAMVKDQGSLRDIVVTLCCSCDYFDEQQINEMIQILSDTENLPARERLKIKADTELITGNHERALEAYTGILRSDDMRQASPAEYAPLFHNIGVAYGLLGEYDNAAEYFMGAYERNHKQESLKCALYALKMADREDKIKEVAAALEISVDKQDEIFAEYGEVRKKAGIAVPVRQVRKLRFLASNGKKAEYQEKIRENIALWKEEYRQEISV